jgi:hypothetical protein
MAASMCEMSLGVATSNISQSRGTCNPISGDQQNPLQPEVFVNGEEVGKAVPRGFFYVDREPGNYKIKTSTEVKRTLSLTLDKGEVRYVRLNISMGFFVGHVYPEIVENEVGESEIQNLRYIGKE